jgi:CBS domain-containing protein
MGIVRNILKAKSSDIYSVSSDCIVYDALIMMYERNISALLVIDDEKLVGIFTERDYARKVILKGKASKEIMVREVMTANLITVKPDSSIELCMRLMTHKFIRHLPVMENNELVGFLSIGDVVKHIIDEQKFIIENLEHYITH